MRSPWAVGNVVVGAVTGAAIGAIKGAIKAVDPSAIEEAEGSENK